MLADACGTMIAPPATGTVSANDSDGTHQSASGAPRCGDCMLDDEAAQEVAEEDDGAAAADRASIKPELGENKLLMRHSAGVARDSPLQNDMPFRYPNERIRAVGRLRARHRTLPVACRAAVVHDARRSPLSPWTKDEVHRRRAPGRGSGTSPVDTSSPSSAPVPAAAAVDGATAMAS